MKHQATPKHLKFDGRIFWANIADAAFFQRPLQGSEKLVGKCIFEPDQLRTASHAALFPFEVRLNATTLRQSGYLRVQRQGDQTDFVELGQR
jgi:hypothetical protein